MSDDIKHLVAWASQECEWQRSGEMSVSRLVDAYYYLVEYGAVTTEAVMQLGHIVEPTKNPPDGWRQTGVRVGWSVKLDHALVPRAMTGLLATRGWDFPTEWFREFEEIHPFVDGNGRVGALLYNWWNETYAPGVLVFPPNLWYDPRRDIDQPSPLPGRDVGSQEGI